MCGFSERKLYMSEIRTQKLEMREKYLAVRDAIPQEQKDIYDKKASIVKFDKKRGPTGPPFFALIDKRYRS